MGNLSGGGGGVVPFKEEDWSKGKREKRKLNKRGVRRQRKEWEEGGRRKREVSVF